MGRSGFPVRRTAEMAGIPFKASRRSSVVADDRLDKGEGKTMRQHVLIAFFVSMAVTGCVDIAAALDQGVARIRSCSDAALMVHCAPNNYEWHRMSELRTCIENTAREGGPLADAAKAYLKRLGTKKKHEQGKNGDD